MMSSHVKPASQVKKRKTRWLGLTKTPIPSLPDDLLVSCLARVSRLYYPILSLVSKRFRSLLVSPELYKAQSLLGRTPESCLYVCIPYPSDLNPRWFTLCPKPDKTLENNLSKKSSGSMLVPVSISSSNHLAQSINLVAVGSKIYGVGREGWSSSPRVSVLDCRNHTWHKGPSMRAKRSCSSIASLVDGKIYVAGGDDSLECVEVFDPKTQTWDSITNPPHIVEDHRFKLTSFGRGGKFYLLQVGFYNCHGAVYNPKKGKWKVVRLNENIGSKLSKRSYCVVDKVLLCWHIRAFKWYDFGVESWKEVKGLLSELNDFYRYDHCKMVDHGGKLVALWDASCYPEDVGNEENKIWCAEITLENHDGEIWGNVEWLDVVLRVPGSCHLLKGGALSVTI